MKILQTAEQLLWMDGIKEHSRSVNSWKHPRREKSSPYFLCQRPTTENCKGTLNYHISYYLTNLDEMTCSLTVPISFQCLETEPKVISSYREVHS